MKFDYLSPTDDVRRRQLERVADVLPEALSEPVLVWPQPDSAAMEKIRASARPRLKNRFICSLLSPLNAVGA